MKIILSLSAAVLVLFCAFGYWTNRQLEQSDFDLPITDLPKELVGLKIVHLSDIHYAHLKLSQKKLLNKIKEASPDLILVTGDTIDRTESLATSNIQALMNDFAVIAPTFVIEGNHEPSSGQYEEWRELMIHSKATLIENESLSLNIGGHQVNLIGLGNRVTDLPAKEKETLANGVVNLLLAHHPELVEEYLTHFSPTTLHAIFSGHAHGGQIRLPGVDGLLAPDQGWLPKLTNGAYHFDTYPDATLFVSRGLSNSSFPLRINNKPHLITVTLTEKQPRPAK